MRKYLAGLICFALVGCSGAVKPMIDQGAVSDINAQSEFKKQSKVEYQKFLGQKFAKNSINTCRTTPDILGPFYKPNAPFRNNVRVENEKGDLLVVKGAVFSKDCKTPLANALVEIWQADKQGNYDNDSNKFLYRASLKTDAKGKYELKTIIPQEYDIGNNQFRPEHLHFKVTAPGHNDLVTQTYFKDDKYIPSDPWASKPEAKFRILELKKLESGESFVQFDIHM